jgi:hypothetical protein
MLLDSFRQLKRSLNDRGRLGFRLRAVMMLQYQRKKDRDAATETGDSLGASTT